MFNECLDITWRKAELKQLKIAKRKEGGIERNKKHEIVKLKEDVPERFYFEKN